MFELYTCLIVLFKAIFAIGCGWMIGSERKKRDKEAGGSRTMALLCLVSTFLAILSLDLYAKFNFDFVRMFAYLLPAVGFMGAGVIQKNKKTIDGLTTSCTLLLVMPIGFAIGLNYYSYAFIITILTWMILESKYWTLRRRTHE